MGHNWKFPHLLCVFKAAAWCWGRMRQILPGTDDWLPDYLLILNVNDSLPFLGDPEFQFVDSRLNGLILDSTGMQTDAASGTTKFCVCHLCGTRIISALAALSIVPTCPFLTGFKLLQSGWPLWDLVSKSGLAALQNWMHLNSSAPTWAPPMLDSLMMKMDSSNEDVRFRCVL